MEWKRSDTRSIMNTGVPPYGWWTCKYVRNCASPPLKLQLLLRKNNKIKLNK